jgi:hypothetical protein
VLKYAVPIVYKKTDALGRKIDHHVYEMGVAEWATGCELSYARAIPLNGHKLKKLGLDFLSQVLYIFYVLTETAIHRTM